MPDGSQRRRGEPAATPDRPARRGLGISRNPRIAPVEARARRPRSDRPASSSCDVVDPDWMIVEPLQATPALGVGFGRHAGLSGSGSAFAAAFVPVFAFGFGVGLRARDPAVAAFHASMSWPAHGSKSDSSGSWPGRSASGTWMRLTRTRYQTADRPRIPSTRMSAGSRYGTTSGWRAFQRLEARQRLLLELGAGDLDDRDRRLAPAGRRRLRADPLGRQARVRIAGGDGGRAFGGDLGRRAARLAATGLVLGLRATRP